MDITNQITTNLKICLGYVENGTSASVSISQDDSTKEFIVTVGNKLYFGTSLNIALMEAATDNQQEDINKVNSHG